VNVLASPTSPQWAIGGIARRGASRSYALGSKGARTVPCRSSLEVCTSELTECLPTTRQCESGVLVMLESTNHASIMSIYGGNAETDLLATVVGQFVDAVGSGPFATCRKTSSSRTSSPIALRGG